MAPNNNRRAPAVGTRKKEGDAHAVTTAPTWMKAPQNIQSSYQPNPPNFLIRAGNSLPTQAKGPPAVERALSNAQLQPHPGQLIIQPPARPLNMHNTRPRKPTSLLFLWHTPSYGLHYWRIIWWWPYPGRSSSHPTPSGMTRVPSVCTIVEFLDTILTPASRSSIKCSI